MTRARHLAAFAIVVACLGAPLACSLNPQPLPPDTPDGSMNVKDGAGGGVDATFGDAGQAFDGAPTAADAEADVDAGTDGAADAADASADAEADAAPDSSPDGAADATSD